MRKIAIVIAGLVAGMGSVAADSLWTADGKAQSLYVDNKATKVGDVLTIVIVETTTGSTQADTKTSSTDSVGGGPGTGSGILKILSNLPEFAADSKSSFSGKGSTTRTGSLVAKMSVVVKNVLPNGSLFVEGVREVAINGEKQEIKLTGTIRTQDVTPENTVLSTNIADAKIEYTGKGPIGRKQRGGLLSRIFDLLF